MASKLRDKMTYANVASTAALVIAIAGGGAATAAALIPNNSVNSAKIVNNSVKSIDIKNGAVKSQDFTEGSVGVVRGYAWINDGATPLDTPVELTNGYVFNASGQPVTVNRTGPGTYQVTFTGNSWGPGHVQVTAYAAGSIFCNSGGWGAPSATVNCYDAAGNLANARFDIAVIE